MKQMEDIESPMIQQVSFNKLLQHYDAQLKSKDKSLATRAKHILDAQAPYPELREGFEDLSILEKRKDVISTILACLLYTSPSPRDRTRSRMPSSA